MVMQQHLILHLASPLIAFGGETIDNIGVIREYPAVSMLTGLFANALGWDRGDAGLHDDLQRRLVAGCVLMPGSSCMQDFQTADLGKNDSGWTTRGVPEGRAGGDSTYDDGYHLRYRDYHTDLRAWVAVALRPSGAGPTINDLATAINKPARPLFIGRKPCLPIGPLIDGWQDAVDVRSALQAIVDRKGGPSSAWKAQWPEGQGRQPGDRLINICDERNWRSGVHCGRRLVREGLLRAGL